MNGLEGLGRVFFLAGLVFVALGVILTLGAKLGWSGRLPGDIRIERGSLTFYFPLATCIVLSLVLTLLLNFFRHR